MREKSRLYSRGVSCIHNAGRIRNAILPEDVCDIIPGKMHPIDLRLICAVVPVFLFLSWAVENHVSSGDDLLCAVEIELRFPRSNIQELEIQPPAGAVAGQHRTRKEPIGAAASDKEGMCPVFEIYPAVLPIGAVDVHKKHLHC